MLEELIYANDYIYSKLSKIPENDFERKIKKLEIEAFNNNIPIISKEVAEFIKFMIQTKNIKNVLEIGTATGYSSIIIYNEIKKNNGQLYTIEIDNNRYEIAKNNFKNFGMDRIFQICGDACEKIKTINEKFDLIFIDASKGHYDTFFRESYKKLNNNGIVIIDNILFRGYLYKNYPKRYKTIVKRLDTFIDKMYLNKNGKFLILPFGDGMGLFTKFGEKNE